MAALAVGDWTVTVNKTRIKGGQRENECTLTIGDGSDTYPTAGIPFPTRETLGMIERIDSVIIVDSALDAGTTTAYVWEWDKTNSTLKGYVSKDPADGGGADIVLQEIASSVALAASTFEIIAYGW